MGLQDLIVTPIYIFSLSLLAFFIRPYVTTPETAKYFLPALWVRFFGAIALGLVYQFYYDGGDTFSYFTNGSKWIWEAFWDNPGLGLKLLLASGGEHFPETFEYSQHIWYYRDPNSYFIVRLAAIIDLITYHTYTATSLFFAVFSFSGLWAFYLAVVIKYPERSQWLAFGILFFPSMVFWGSGILKDTITLGALGWLTWGMIYLVEQGKRSFIYWIAIFISVFLIYSIKTYILVCYLPIVLLWIYWNKILSIKNLVVRVLVAPILVSLFGVIGYMSVVQFGEINSEFAIENISERAAITAYDIRYGWGARTSGDGGYDLGELDGSWQSMIRLFPQAVNVSLFRPYLWEVKNPLMLLASIESTLLLLFTLWFLFYRKGLLNFYHDPFLMFCFLFALLFAFAVGVSTYNFGTLMRYKIPLMSFYIIAMVTSHRFSQIKL